jgi:cytochrome b subunit of formate dehydrogenase
MAVCRIFVFSFAAMLNMVAHALVRCGFYNAICCHMPKTQQKKAIQWLIAVVAFYGLLLLIAGIILYSCGVIKL